MNIIGITGTLGAGKGTIVEYLIEKKGYIHYSVRAFIAKEIQNRGLDVNRDTLTMVANDLRATHSPSYILDCLYEEACIAGKNAVIEKADRMTVTIATQRRILTIFLFMLNTSNFLTDFFFAYITSFNVEVFAEL